MKIKKGFILRQIGGENVVVSVGEMSKQFHGMVNLNGTGCFLWKFFTADHTAEEGTAALLEEYDIDEATAAEDVKEFMDALQRHGFAE